MSLQIKYRPKALEEVVGNDSVKESIASIFKRDKEDIPHAYLFFGPTGTGKTTMERIVASMLGCPEEEIAEYNMSNLRGIDTVRSLNDTCIFSTMSGNPRVYILDEIHRQTKDAQNALLKLLEDPPKDVYFILGTTEPEALLDTLRGRCNIFQMKRLKPGEMMHLIDVILNEEGFDATDYPDKIKKEIIRLSEGLPRNALTLLDNIIDIDDADTAFDALSAISLDEVNGKEIYNALLKKESWDSIRKQVKQLIQENDPEKVRRSLLGYMKVVLYNSKTHNRASEIIEEFKQNTYDGGEAQLVNMFYYVCQK